MKLRHRRVPGHSNLGFITEMKWPDHFKKFDSDRRLVSLCLYFKLLIFILLSVVVLCAQTSFTLSEIYKLALERNSVIKISEIQQSITDVQLEEAYSLRMPSVSLNSMYTHTGEITSFSIPMGGETRKLMFGTPDRVNANIQFRMPLYTSGVISRRISAAERQHTINKLQISLNRIRLIDKVLRQYYSVVFFQEMVRTAEGNLEWATNHLKTAEERFKTGHAPRMDVLRARVQLSSAHNSLEEFRNNLRLAKISLANLIGLKEENFRITDSLGFETMQFREEGLIQHALDIRTDLKSTKLKKEILQEQVNIQAKSGMPNISFVAGYSITNGFDPMQPDKFIDNWNMGLQLMFPIFEPFPASSRAQIASYQLSIVKYEQAELEKTISLQVRQGIITLRQAESRIKAREENWNLTKETLLTAETQYEQGLISSLELMEARKSVYQNEMLYLQALFDHIIARIDLCRIMEDYSWFTQNLE